MYIEIQVMVHHVGSQFSSFPNTCVKKEVVSQHRAVHSLKRQSRAWPFQNRCIPLTFLIKPHNFLQTSLR